jgi:hypothetical protein
VVSEMKVGKDRHTFTFLCLFHALHTEDELEKILISEAMSLWINYKTSAEVSNALFLYQRGCRNIKLSVPLLPQR